MSLLLVILLINQSRRRFNSNLQGSHDYYNFNIKAALDSVTNKQFPQKEGVMVNE